MDKITDIGLTIAFVPAIWILLTVASSVWAKNKCKYGRHAGYVLNGRLVCTSCGHESQ